MLHQFNSTLTRILYLFIYLLCISYISLSALQVKYLDMQKFLEMQNYISR